MTKIGFIGTGNFARQHAEILKEIGTEIVACYGTNKEKTTSFANDFQCKIYNDAHNLISRDIIDALYIVIPPYAHDGNVEMQAIENRIPFLCEKPVGLNLSTCNTISNEIERTNLITSSGYLLRHEPLLTDVKEILNRNLISTIRICSYSYMPEIPWWRQEILSGGMMIESGTHYIDLLRYLFGEINSVAAITSSGLAHNQYNDCLTYDSMEAILTFQSGCIGSIGVTHLLNNIKARHDMLEVYGLNFALKIDLFNLRYKNEGRVLYKEANDSDWQTITNFTSKQALLKFESLAFIHAAQKGDPSLIKSTYQDAVKSLEVTMAMTKSAQSGQFIKI